MSRREVIWLTRSRKCKGRAEDESSSGRDPARSARESIHSRVTLQRLPTSMSCVILAGTSMTDTAENESAEDVSAPSLGSKASRGSGLCTYLVAEVIDLTRSEL